MFMALQQLKSKEASQVYSLSSFVGHQQTIIWPSITRESLMLLNLYYLYGISSIVIERFAHILTYKSIFPVLQHACIYVSQ